MSTFSPLYLLGALGVLSAAASSALAAPDLSKWKCETCPFEKSGISGSVDAGIGIVSDDSARFGDYTGLDRKGGHLLLGGDVHYRADGGFFANLAGDLTRGWVAADLGTEGRYALRLRYAEIPRYLSDNAQTPFLGVGSGSLSLPAVYAPGFSDTGAMPLATTLNPVELSTTRKRFEFGVAVPAGSSLSFGLNLRHETRDGLQAMAGSFFSTSSQLPVPVDTVTDQFEVSARYSRGKLNGMIAYQASLFRNAINALNWANPFTPVIAGASAGQMALAPDNEFHQIIGSAGYVISPKIRANADFAVGRLTQDEPFLAYTLSPNLGTVSAPGTSLAVPALPQASLQGKVDTFSGNVGITATPQDRLRINASYSRNVRDNRTPVATYASVVTDMFLGATTPSNHPYTFKQNRYKLSADYRGAGSLKLSAGLDANDMHRSYQEAVDTREAALWAKADARPFENTHLSVKLSHAERDNSGYGVLSWVTPAENPLLRKFNLADRTRNAARLRADVALSETLSIGVNADLANDDYSNSPIGLVSARNASLGADVSAALTEEIRVNAYAQADRIRSRQLGSQAYSVADWSGSAQDKFHIVGIGIKRVKDKLELGADFTLSRSRSSVTVDTGAAGPGFPTATTALDSVKLYASYRLKDNLTLIGTFWHERYDSADWRVDGIMPSTLSNFLAFGEQSPQYRVNVLRAAVRYGF